MPRVEAHARSPLPGQVADASLLVVHAGFWRQMAALLIDSLLMTSGGSILAWMAFLMAVVVPVAMDSSDGFTAALIIALVVQWLAGVAYSALSEASGVQATLGKLALGIKVVDLQGERISLKRATIRAVLQSPLFALGYFLIPFTRHKHGLHDVLAGTRVVDRWAWTEHPERQSRAANRIAAWIGVPAAVALGIALLRPQGFSWPQSMIDSDVPIAPAPGQEALDQLAPGLASVPMDVAIDGEPRGMTWGFGSPTRYAGVVSAACNGQPYAPTEDGRCDAYRGDTACSSLRPVLCLRRDDRPPPETSLSDSWSYVEIALTPSIAGSALTSRGDADAYCRAHLGAQWRMAEHHDSRIGWLLHANGEAEPGTRFWVAIDDQPANCWSRQPPLAVDAGPRPADVQQISVD